MGAFNSTCRVCTLAATAIFFLTHNIEAKPGDSKDDSKDDENLHPYMIEFVYTGGSCADSADNEQFLADSDKAWCLDSVDGCVPASANGATADIVFQDYKKGDMPANGEHFVKVGGVSSSRFTVGSSEEKLPAELLATVTDETGCTQEILIHASCSLRLYQDMQFGSLMVLNIMDENGDIVSEDGNVNFCDKSDDKYDPTPRPTSAPPTAQPTEPVEEEWEPTDSPVGVTDGGEMDNVSDGVARRLLMQQL